MSTTKRLRCGEAQMTLSTINLAFGLERYNRVDDILNMTAKQFARDVIKINDLTEKMKLLNIENFPACQGTFS